MNAKGISELLLQLEYPVNNEFIEERVTELRTDHSFRYRFMFLPQGYRTLSIDVVDGIQLPIKKILTPVVLAVLIVHFILVDDAASVRSYQCQCSTF